MVVVRGRAVSAAGVRHRVIEHARPSAPEDRAVDHRGPAHAGHDVAPAIAVVAHAVENDPDHEDRQQHQQEARDRSTGGVLPAVAAVVIIRFAGVDARRGAVMLGVDLVDHGEGAQNGFVIVSGVDAGVQRGLEAVDLRFGDHAHDRVAAVHVPRRAVRAGDKDEDHVVRAEAPLLAQRERIFLLIPAAHAVHRGHRADGIVGVVPGGVALVDDLLGLIGDHVGPVIDPLGIFHVRQCGRRFAQPPGAGEQDRQHQHHSGYAAFLKEFHRLFLSDKP